MLEAQSADTVAQQILALQRFSAVLLGLVIWETLINLDYDWRLVQRQPLPWPPATWAYLVSRISVLTFVIMITIRMIYIPPYLVITSSSLLIAFRTMVVWSYDIRVVVITLAGWLTEFGMALYTIIDVDPLRVVELTANGTLVHCGNKSTRRIVFNLAITLAYNILLFVLTLVVVWRQRRATSHGLWRTLWNQGLIWLCSCAAVFVPCLIIVAMNFDEIVSSAVLIATDLTLYVSATRMFRQLHTYSSDSSRSQVVYDTDLPHLTTVITSQSEDDALSSSLRPFDTNRKPTDVRELDLVARTPSVSTAPPSRHSLSQSSACALP